MGEETGEFIVNETLAANPPAESEEGQKRFFEFPSLVQRSNLARFERGFQWPEANLRACPRSFQSGGRGKSAGSMGDPRR